MAVDWLLLWGAGKAAGKPAKPVLESLAKDIAKDHSKKLVGKAKKRVANLLGQDEFLRACLGISAGGAACL